MVSQEAHSTLHLSLIIIKLCDLLIFSEDVIRRRLLIDGDGTGDDRRLNVLLKTLIKWCNSTDEKHEDRLEFFGNL